MKASEIIDPAVLEMPFALNGDKNNIPATNLPSTGDASQSLGFPPVTQVSVDAGGIPPDRKDFNGLGYLTTSHSFYAQNGNFYTFSENVSSAIGGYPLGAKLWYTDSNNRVRLLKSAKDDNTDNFLTNPEFVGASWIDCIPTQDYIDTNFINNDERTNCITGWNEDIKYEFVPYSNTITIKSGSKFYVPNGLDNFETVVLNSDLSRTAWSDSGYMVFYYDTDNNTIQGENFIRTISGATGSFGGQYRLWYDTTNNIIKRYDNNDQVICEKASFPFMVVKSDGSIFTSVFRVYNGYGVCGSSYFVLPGLKFSLAHGYNSDGTINNIEVENNRVNVYTRNWQSTPVASNELVILSNAANGDFNPDNYPTDYAHIWWLNHYYCQNDEPDTKEYTLWYNPSLRKTFFWGSTETWTYGWKENPAIPLLLGSDHGALGGSATNKIISINGLRNTYAAADTFDIETAIDNRFRVVATPPAYQAPGVFYFCTNS